MRVPRVGITLLAWALIHGGVGWTQVDPLQPAGTGGVAAIDRALARVETHRRVLVVGAHPDDEDTALLTFVARGLGGEAAYLSLTRGDGGQNLIGPELGEELGVLRTEELLAARRVDGARQYFTRAYDFGYSKSLQETLEQWPSEQLIEDVVRIVRKFRPQVLVSIFPSDERAGHGQHQAAGWIARQAFEVAGGPDLFPNLTAEGLPPWAPSRLYRSAWFEPESATLTLPTGVIDGLTGRSLYQIAMESRSQHRCQSFGSLQPIGPREVRLRRELPAPDPTLPDQLFGDLETRLRGVADLGSATSDVSTLLAEVEEGVARARQRLAPQSLHEPAQLASLLDELTGISYRLRQALSLSRDHPHAAAILTEKLAFSDQALVAAHGLVFDATTEGSDFIPGQPVAVRVELWNASGRSVRVHAAPQLVSPGRWFDGSLTVEPTASSAASTLDLAPGELWSGSVDVVPEVESQLTVPYWLLRPRRGALYDGSATPSALLGEPSAPGPLQARVELRFFHGEEPVDVVLEREVVARRRDIADGEVRTPLRIAPALQVATTPERLLMTRGGPSALPVEASVEVRLQATRAVGGSLRATVPMGWPTPPPVPFQLEAGEVVSHRIDVALPRGVAAGRYPIAVRAELDSDSGQGWAQPPEPFVSSLTEIDYPHVRTRWVAQRAVTEIDVFDLKIPDLGRVLYVPGADRSVAEALAAVGLPIEVVGPEALSTELQQNGGSIGAVVIGSRAYESSPELHDQRESLDRWLRAGGLLVVEFQRWGYFEAEHPPFPLKLTRRERQRTTDEASPVRLLPGARAETWLNPMSSEDWDGWVQERGTYYPVEWSDEYSPWLAFADPDEEEALGAILEAPVEEGVYIYTGVAFFRQLPAGVPGAFRLFANLLARSPRQSSESTR